MKDKPFEKPAECPYCFYSEDAHTNADAGDNERVPASGSLSMCLRCGQFSIFTQELDLQRLTDDDNAEIDAETRRFMDRLHAHWTKTAKPLMEAKYGKPFTQEPR